MNKYICSFNLEGHTPIIHFEKLRIKALRPTELKSKLDKFLINSDLVQKNKIQKTTDGRKFLKYKVRIKNIKIKNSLSGDIQKGDRKIPFYFGNMGDEYISGDKQFVFIDSLKVEVFTFDKEMLKTIKENFEKFIAQTNFGTRQNKGYGSFYIKGKNFNESLINNLYKFHISEDDYKKAMHDVEIFYKFIRSGINLPRSENPFYTKPAIWKYFKDRGILWEKKAIKRRCFRDKLNEQKIKHNNDEILTFEGEERIVRDLLGLSVSQQWRSYGVSVEKENPFIKRFKSPLMIKMIKSQNGYDVYMWNEKRNEEKLNDFCNQNFNIKAGRCSFSLTTASFNLDDFLRWIERKNERLISELSDNSNTKEYRTIKNILKQFKKVN